MKHFSKWHGWAPTSTTEASFDSKNWPWPLGNTPSRHDARASNCLQAGPGVCGSRIGVWNDSVSAWRRSISSWPYLYANSFRTCAGTSGFLHQDLSSYSMHSWVESRLRKPCFAKLHTYFSVSRNAEARLDPHLHWTFCCAWAHQKYGDNPVARTPRRS